MEYSLEGKGMSTKLKPCPFCGGEAHETIHLEYAWFAPVCKSCGVRGPSVRIPRGTEPQELRKLLGKADELWNTRVVEGEWKEMILDQLMIYGLYKVEYSFDPRAALKAMIDWEVSVALDPAVSLEAQKLLYANPPTVPKEILK